MAKRDKMKNWTRAIANLLKIIEKVNDSLNIKYCGINVQQSWIKIM